MEDKTSLILNLDSHKYPYLHGKIRCQASVIQPFGGVEVGYYKELNVVWNRNLSELGGELPTMIDVYFT